MPDKDTTKTTHTEGGVPVQNNTKDTDDSRVPLSAEPGVYKNDGTRQVPISAEEGAYKQDNRNSPKKGTAGDEGVRIEHDNKGPGSK
ncbi:hypothetical protein VFPPC_14768 [Pochonia chlamydosporia 170]|uniref:Uncharacterized protein n=1 Tax=Pochonia chlamydosporia 170 TaxID=1380566 RepID=A0A179F1S5_METCM|nr:hypothetical protein VFPPC_14768 [Pochonia chlamydosporia 170]OAQ59406.2 hypothetical protein VFPPC_14768 [Pochonia chlamydosporia 170]